MVRGDKMEDGNEGTIKDQSQKRRKKPYRF